MFTPILPSALANGSISRASKAAFIPWSAAAAIKTMDENDITASIISNPFVLTGPKALEHYRAQNEEYARIAKENPTRIGVFASLPLANMDDTLKELEYALDKLKMMGFACPRAWTENGLAMNISSRFGPSSTAAIRRVRASVHPSISTRPAWVIPCVMEFMFESTRMITNMVYSEPSGAFRCEDHFHHGAVQCLISHGASDAGRVPGIGDGKFASPEEVRADLKTFYFDLTACTTPNAMPAILDLVPSSQLMIGFDWPMMPPTLIKPAQNFIRTTPLLSDADRTAIFGGQR